MQSSSLGVEFVVLSSVNLAEQKETDV